MNTKKRKLNRGLERCWDRPDQKSAGRTASEHNITWDGDLRQLPLEFYNAVNIGLELTLMKPLQELADSIKAGVMQPIVVRSIGADRYEIVAGERRWRASQLAALNAIPAIVRDITMKQPLQWR